MREELASGRRADHTEEELLPRDRAQHDKEEASLSQGAYVLRQETQAATAADEAALHEYVLAWGRADGDPRALTALLREEVLLKTYPRSVRQLAPLVADKQEPSALRLLARVCEAKKDYDRAIDLLTAAIRTAPDDVAALTILARVRAKRDGEAAAVPWHERILEVNPQVRASLFFLARWYYAQGQYETALPYWERLFLRERHNRVCELYWLLTTIHCYGVHGLEKRLAAVQFWQDLTAEERSLLHQLFLLVAKHRLQAGELDLAEQALRFALRLMPAREGERLLAEVKQRKKEVGRQAHPPDTVRGRGQPAAADLDTFIASWALTLYEEDRRKRFAVAKRLGVIALILLVGVGGLWSYRQFQPAWLSVAFWKFLPFLRQEERTGAAEQAATLPSALAEISEGETRKRSLGPEHRKDAIVQVSPPYREEAPKEKVVAAIEVGMQMSGSGVRDPQRSPAVIQQTVAAALPVLQELYAQARVTDPWLLGSVVLDFTIEASGQVTRARVRTAKLDHRGLWDGVLTHVRTWRFPPASGAVRVSFPLFFVPAEIDVTSVALWEKYTALSKAEREKLAPTANKPTEKVASSPPVLP